MDFSCPSIANDVDLVAATLHSRATMEGEVSDNIARAKKNGEKNVLAMKGDWVEKNQIDYSFIRKLISNTIDSKNIFRLAGFDFDLAADVFDMSINGAFIGFKRHTMDRVQ